MWKTIWQLLSDSNTELYDPEIPLVGIYPKGLRTLLHNYFSSTNYNIPKVENSQMPTDQWIDNQRMVYLYNKYYLAIKEKKYWYMLWYKERYYAKWKKQDTRGHILYNPIYMKFLEEANNKDKKKTGSCQGLGIMESNAIQGIKFPFRRMKTF